MNLALALQLIIILVAFSSSCNTCAASPVKSIFEPQQSSVMDERCPDGMISYTEGVVGGFIPAKKKYEFAAMRTNLNGQSIVQAKLQIPSENIDVEFLIDPAEFCALARELEQVLRLLPTEAPQGSEDIYGQDTRIIVHLSDFMWSNQPPSGCMRAKSTARASDTEKQCFSECAKLIKQFAFNHYNKVE